MPAEYPKAIKRQLRELMALAYERELAQALTKLDEHFAAWKRGEINPFELSDLIHQFHQKTARELFNRYDTRGDQDMIVSGSVAIGILSRSDIPDEVWPHIESRVEFFRKVNE